MLIVVRLGKQVSGDFSADIVVSSVDPERSRGINKLSRFDNIFANDLIPFVFKIIVVLELSEGMFALDEEKIHLREGDLLEIQL